jgi:predicted transposase YdaD
MSKPYDATTKYLIDLDPSAWLRLAGVMAENSLVQTLDSDLSTVTASADRLLRMLTPYPHLYHLELQASYDGRQDERVHWYSTLARYEYRLPVRSIVFLLRPQADGPRIRGEFVDEDRIHRLAFRYQVVRLWELSPETLLAGGLATLPLAPLTVSTEREAAPIIAQMRQRLDREADKTQAQNLWISTYVMMGLSYAPDTIGVLLQGVLSMKESATYQLILSEGRAEGIAQGREALQETILRLGERRFGPADATVRKRLGAYATLDELQQVADRLLEVETWTELLA